MANGVAKGNKLKRSMEDDNELRSVKRKTTHDIQEKGNEQIDIVSLFMKTPDVKFVLNTLKLIMAVVYKHKIWHYLSTVSYATVRLEQNISGKTLFENPRCRFCADTPSCPLQFQNIKFTEPPVNWNSEKVIEEEKNEVEASKKAVSRDEKL
ncbi:uncharacterized protein EAF02_007890 [Botrytis sinoallii]|uniref:uncharacterized protein n=1 Tax=Botrytis sinoallii TaxID=1463999 RepID=UPI0018FF78AC|nr:uncharacterized protein EAF02_007890 [Botrytis sinoallii]KAF7879720.1 hypothetical protein EAF02_007890 [Botrytis sinoallii]